MIGPHICISDLGRYLSVQLMVNEAEKVILVATLLIMPKATLTSLNIKLSDQNTWILSMNTYVYHNTSYITTMMYYKYTITYIPSSL